jgi:hypothetical protein
VLAGGARGGGKSDVLLGDIAIKASIYGNKFRALFLRRTLAEMSEIHRRAGEIYPKLGATWMESKETWTFPNGATCRMTYIEDDRDAERYMGFSVTYIAVDECGNFPSPEPLDKLFGALRSPEGIPVFRRMTCNPGGPGHCIDEGEVLTPGGWRDIKAFAPGDPVFTVDASGKMVETRVSQVHRSWYEGDLVRAEARGFYLSCTPNHSVVKVGGTRATRKATGQAQPFSLVPFEQLPGQATILRSVKWVGEQPKPFALPALGRREDYPTRWYDVPVKSQPSKPQPTELPAEKYATLMGWFLSEGCVVDRDYAFQIAQCKEENREKIRCLLAECGFNFREDPTAFYVNSFPWYLYMKQFGKCRDKWVPDEIMRSPEPVLRAFFEAAMDGDGHRESRDGGTYYTISKRLADQFAEVALKLGYIVYVSSRQRENRVGLSYAVNFKKTESGGTELLTGHHRYDVTTTTKRRSDVTRVPYAGYVYCLGIDSTHTFIVRQNGCVWVSGNSWILDRYIRHGAWQIRSWQPQPLLAPNVWVQSVFIPAKLEDNKILMANDPMYDARLAMVGDSTLYRAWRDGDWNILAGVYFDNFREEDLVYDPPEIKPWWPRYLAGDWGFSSWSAFYWGAWDGERLWIYRELSERGLDPSALAERIVEANNGEKIDRFFFSHDAFSKRTSDRSMAQEIADLFMRREAPIPAPEPADTNRVAGWQLMYQGFRQRSVIISPSCRRLITTIPTLVRDPKNLESVLKTKDDHWADALRYLMASRLRADIVMPREIKDANFVDEVSDMNVRAMRARLVAAKSGELAPVRLVGRMNGYR